MRFTLVIIFAIATFALAEQPAKDALATTKSDTAAVATQDSTTDTDTVAPDDGIPWNRDRFDPSRLVRHDTFDPALKVAYSYSVSFLSTPFGSISQNSFLAHLAYEFTPDLHLYADLGLWMPFRSTFRDGPFSKEDMRQGQPQFVLPALALEYKPSENTYIRLMLINEKDAFRAYGPTRLYEPCAPWRESFWCR